MFFFFTIKNLNKYLNYFEFKKEFKKLQIFIGNFFFLRKIKEINKYQKLLRISIFMEN